MLPRIQPIAPKRIQAPFDHTEFVFELKMVRVRGTIGTFVTPQPGIGGVIADNYAEASRLFNSDEFYDCSRWLLGQHQRLPIHGEFVLVACAYDERALCHRGFRCQHVGGHCVRAGIEVNRIKDRDLVSVGCLVI